MQVATAAVNYTLGFIMTITIMSTLGDVESVLGTVTGQPYIQVIFNATQSRIGTSILTAVMAVLLLFCAVNLVTTASRQIFAFARDKGLPFSSTLAYVCVSSRMVQICLQYHAHVILGPAWLGYSTQFCIVHTLFYQYHEFDHHRLVHCIQHHHIHRRGRDTWLLHCSRRLHCN